jgi:putative restriction endonuclease
MAILAKASVISYDNPSVLGPRAMRYWWVNQNQTFRHELAGAYLWSPKRNANGARNPFYESMREVSPGDVIFSFVDTRTAAIGIAKSYCWEVPKPVEFGDAGPNWENVGWKSNVRFTTLLNKVRPKDHIAVLRTVLPSRYSRLQANGNGVQSIYLNADRLAADTSIGDTDRGAIIRARRGQGLFKQRVMRIEQRCRITAVDNPIHLMASHCKPWRDSSNEERLDGENGLLLTPSIDHLFDRDFVGFEDSGRLIISPVAHLPSLQRMGVETKRVVNVGGFTEGRRKFLDFHRNAVLLRAVR